MKRTLLASVAAAGLLAAAGIANAQNPGQGNMNQKADPPGSSQRPAATPSPATPSPNAGRNAAPQAQTQSPAMQNSTSGDVKSGSNIKADTGKGDTKSSASGSASGSATKPSATTDTKPSTNTATDTKPSTNTASDTKSPAASSTTGAAPSSGAAAAPPAEKRTQIVDVIKTEKVEPVTNVNFSLTVGAKVPSTVRYYPIPARVVEIYPEWRGYYFILVNGKYVILRPQTYEIVYILEV